MLTDTLKLNETLTALVNEVIKLSVVVESNDQALRQMLAVAGTRLTRKEVMERLRVSQSTLGIWIKAGKFPPPDSDNKWLVSEIMDWERDQIKRKAT